MAPVRIILVCEFSGIGRRAFAAKGHDVWSCDLRKSEDDSPKHLQCDALTILDRDWDMMIAHPECTYLTRAGWRWVNAPDQDSLPLKGKPRLEAAYRAADFFRALLKAPIKKKCIENPRPIGHVGLPKSTQIIQPWQHGHGETKETHLWLENLPPLKPSNIVSGREGRIFRMPPGPERAKERSRSYPGIMQAMAEQWG